MTPLTLPSGATAVLREPRMVTERLRRPFMRAQRRLASSDLSVIYLAAQNEGRELTEAEGLEIAAHPDADLLEDLDYLAVAALVAEWSYDFPVSADTVLDLPSCDLDALRAAVRPLIPQMSPNFTPTPDPDSPTPPSAGSPSLSAAAPEGLPLTSGVPGGC